MESIPSDHVTQFNEFISGACGPSLKIAIEELRTSGELDEAGLRRILEEGGKFNSRLIPSLKRVIKEMTRNIQGCVRLVSVERPIVITKTNGKEVLAHASELFGYIDPDFLMECSGEALPAAEMPVEMFEVVESNDFTRIFGSFDIHLDRLCLSQHQIKMFVRDYRDKLSRLKKDGGSTFFLFKVETQFFVARVRVRFDGWLWIGLCRFPHDHVWRAEDGHRIVVPQLIRGN